MTEATQDEAAGASGRARFDRLLDEMPAIAAAVNAFTSDTVQLQAFEALIRTFEQHEGGAHASGRSAPAVPTAEARPAAKNDQANSTTRRIRTRRRGSLGSIKDLSLRPAGKQAFTEFAAEKAPGTMLEKNVVSVYYLAKILGLTKVTAEHVNTCYQEMSWKRPANFENYLAKTASEKSWLATSNMDNIGISQRGEDFVIHDLPPKADKKK